jgi:hypothetical protein
MDSVPRRSCQALVAAALAAVLAHAHAQKFEADYRLRVGPAVTLGGAAPGAGLSLQGNRNWFGLVGLSHGPTSQLNHAGSNDIMALEGGYRWGNGQSLSLQLSRARGPSSRLGLAVNYDWPHYFVRFSYDPPGFTLSPADSLRLSAGVRF